MSRLKKMDTNHNVKPFLLPYDSCTLLNVEVNDSLQIHVFKEADASTSEVVI
jgi:hypothetical protein